MNQTLIYYLVVEPNIVMRAIIVNYGVMMVFLVGAWVIRNQRRTILDTVLVALVFLCGLQYGIRTNLVLTFANETLTVTNYQDSTYAIALQFSSAFFALALAVCLFIALGMDFIEKLNEEAGIDPLSGLLNRRGLGYKADKIIEQHNRSNLPLCLVVCDLDHFKKINDIYGHNKGDQIIQGMGELLQVNIRHSDIAARIGGEEFCIILWNTNVEGGKLFAEGLRTIFEEQYRNKFNDGYGITSSFGIAQMIKDESYEALFERADKALYEAKNSGRNRVCVSTKTDERVNIAMSVI